MNEMLTAVTIVYISVISCTLCYTTEVVNIQSLESRGVLFESIGTVRLSRGSATIITTIPSIDWSPALRFIEQSEKSIDILCNKRNAFKGFSLDSCHHWHEEFEIEKQEIVEQVRKLHEWTTNRRRKRALVSVIGQISKFLFGTMDEEDAGEVYARIQALEQHENENLQVLKNGMAIIQSNANFLRNAINNITAKENSINQRIEHFQKLLNSEIKYLSENIRATHIQTEVNQIALFVVTKMSQINKYLNEHFDILSALQQHKLHPLILTGTEIIKVIQKTYPMPLHPMMSRSTDVEQLATIHTISLEGNIVIRIDVPLVRQTEYSLHKIYPVPVITSTNTYTLFEIPEAYILNNTKLSHFMGFKEKDFLTQCFSLKPNGLTPVYVCKQVQPIHIGSDSNNCLSNLFYTPTNSQTGCPYRVGKGLTNQIVKLTHPNAWLFILVNPQTLIAHCRSDTQSIVLKDTGLLTLKQPCDFQLANLLLPYDSKYTSTVEFHQPKEVKIPIFNTDQGLLALNNLNPSVSVTSENQSTKLDLVNEFDDFFRSNTKSIEAVQAEISRIEINRQLEKHKKTQITHTVLSFSLISLAGIILCLRIGIKCYKRRSRPTNSVPLPTVIKIGVDKEQSITTANRNEDEEKVEKPIKSQHSSSVRKNKGDRTPVPQKEKQPDSLKENTPITIF